MGGIEFSYPFSAISDRSGVCARVHVWWTLDMKNMNHNLKASILYADTLVRDRTLVALLSRHARRRPSTSDARGRLAASARGTVCVLCMYVDARATRVPSKQASLHVHSLFLHAPARAPTSPPPSLCITLQGRRHFPRCQRPYSFKLMGLSPPLSM